MLSTIHQITTYHGGMVDDSIRMFFLVILAVATVSCGQSPHDILAPAKAPAKAPTQTQAPTQAAKETRTKPAGLEGRVVAGYQGWFRATGDGSGLDFQHYQKRGRFQPGHCSIDLWPDLSEFDEDEKFPTPFVHEGGSPAHVFSSIHPKTVNRHFSWMAEYGIDGAFVQRFAVQVVTRGKTPAPQSRRYHGLEYENRKLMLCRDAAIRHNRCWVLMYDLSGMRDEDFQWLTEDWKHLRQRMQLGTDTNDSAYLQLNGKPLIAIWGVGFKDRNYSLDGCAQFIRLLKGGGDSNESHEMSIMLGVPYYWRTQDRDAMADPDFHSVVELADVVSPWSVGRYGQRGYSIEKLIQHQQKDGAWCAQRDIMYLPVLFPGFSWKNLKGEDAAKQSIPRLKGKFFTDQFAATARAGSRAAYIAMFDELDEGTAIFKCTNNPPVGESDFQTLEGLPSDAYLRMSGAGRRQLLQGNSGPSDDPAKR